jgi:site-specific DNA-methyltransferase (adenine-specific)
MHPCEKPVELLQYLIRTYTNEGDTVLDNCIGSGTTAVACIKEKRHFIGFELNKEYYDKAVERINRKRAQLTLF